MRRLFSHRVACGVIAFALATSTMLTAVTADASPASVTQQKLAAKQAQQAAAQAELGQMRMDLTNSVATFLSVGHDLERTRQQISEVTTELAQQNESLAQAQSELTSRAIELYRSDRVGMVEALLTSTSVEDFIFRTHYLMLISQRDAMLLRDVRLGQAESLYLQQSLADREAQLVKLQAEADQQRTQITNSIAATQARATKLGSDITALMVAPVSSSSGATFSGGSPSSSFDPNTVITSANYHAATSMSAADIQSFLDSQPGSLKSYRAKDHAGQVKTAAQMIADAAVAYNISPKVILVTLQKEQSLLSLPNPSASAYQWAMGAGKADTFTVAKDAGFGNQIWIGAQKLRSNADLYHTGATLDIENSIVRPTNDATFAQWRYTPHFSGVMSFWMLYWRYFGNPLA